MIRLTPIGIFRLQQLSCIRADKDRLLRKLRRQCPELFDRAGQQKPLA